MRIKYIGIVSMLLLITISNSYRTEAQSIDSSTKDNNLANRLIKDVALEGQLWYVLTSLLLDYDIPLGLEISADEQLSNRYRVELSEGAVTDVMSQIISQNQRYDWVLEKGVLYLPARQISKRCRC